MRYLLYSFLLCFHLSFSISNAQWQNGQDASLVMGKPNFTTGATPGTNSQNMSLPASIAIDLTNGKLYVTDEANNRVLRFSYPIISNNPTAEIVFGQPDFKSKGYNANQQAPSANTLDHPGSIIVYKGTLWIADNQNYRILRFDNAHAINTNAPNANGVLGQKDFSEHKILPGGASFGGSGNNLINLAIDSIGNLFAADGARNRILRFDNAANKVNGANADGILGQHTYGDVGKAINEWGMSYPNGLAIDKNGHLYVADNENNRVLRFNNAATKSDGADADGVLGQLNFNTKDYHIDQNGTYFPLGLAIDGSGRLYVSDGMRVTIFNNAAEKVNGANADFVIGYPDFTSYGFKGVTASTFNITEGIAVDDAGRLFVADRGNSRVLQFNSAWPLPVHELKNELPATTEIFPNPAHENLFLKFTLLKDEKVQIEIYSTLGEKVLKTIDNYQGNIGENALNISLKELPVGSYTVRIRTGEKVETKQFSIIR